MDETDAAIVLTPSQPASTPHTTTPTEIKANWLRRTSATIRGLIDLLIKGSIHDDMELLLIDFIIHAID